MPLDERQAHHARDVLRLPGGSPVEVFDDHGATATATLHWDDPGPRVRVHAIESRTAAGTGVELIVAAAVPKGDRADWMIEKLAELNVAEFIPLAAARSVVLPEGRNKRERWVRVATEAAKQSRRTSVMRVGELTPVRTLLGQAADPRVARWCLSTEPGSVPIGPAAAAVDCAERLIAFVGPEGGWTADEVAAFDRAGVTRVTLARTILRVETAAVAIAVVVAALGPVASDRATT